MGRKQQEMAVILHSVPDAVRSCELEYFWEKKIEKILEKDFSEKKENKN